MVHELLCKRDARIDKPQLEHEEEEEEKHKRPYPLSPEGVTTVTSFVGEPEEQGYKRENRDPYREMQEAAVPGDKGKKEQRGRK